jgi:formate dehydrogenase maturation protein FdhE
MRVRNAKELIGEVASLGGIQQSLESLTDRQIGQLMFDRVWNEVPMISGALGIVIEATERLFRSPAGVRGEHEEFNDIEHLPDCPLCGEAMLHYVGIGEPDFRKCNVCACKIPEGKVEKR